jgi:hypothetical protein
MWQQAMWDLNRLARMTATLGALVAAVVGFSVSGALWYGDPSLTSYDGSVLAFVFGPYVVALACCAIPVLRPVQWLLGAVAIASAGLIIVYGGLFLIPAAAILLYAARIPRTPGASHGELAASSAAIGAVGAFAVLPVLFALHDFMSFAGAL